MLNRVLNLPPCKSFAAGQAHRGKAGAAVDAVAGEARGEAALSEAAVAEAAEAGRADKGFAEAAAEPLDRGRRCFTEAQCLS